MLNKTTRYLFASVAMLACVLGCEGKPSSDSSQVTWMDPNSIQQGPILHETLPDGLLLRIEKVQAVFADVDGTPLDKWIEDFKRDLDPEGNVKIWEDMAVAYKSFCDNRELPLDTRNEVYKVVLMRSMMPNDEVLSHLELKHISVDDAKAIVAAYPGEAKPIEVISK